jgi:hypothetical protein
MFNRISKPEHVASVAGNDWPAHLAEDLLPPEKRPEIFRRRVPQRLLVSGAGSGAAIAFLPAKASPEAKDGLPLPSSPQT